jgi:hypothetical protein
MSGDSIELPSLEAEIHDDIFAFNFYLSGANPWAKKRSRVHTVNIFERCVSSSAKQKLEVDPSKAGGTF